MRGALVTATLVGLMSVDACGERQEPTPARLSVAQLLGGADTAGFARALEPRPFVFPEDHGPHPAFRSEWWYVTANLADSEGRPFGVQLTLFRSALAPTAQESPSAWATNQAYMAHFALTDPRGAGFRAVERFARGAAGLAGARAEPFRAWLEDWSLEDGGDGAFLLRAVDGGTSVSLRLELGKPIVLQGDDGLSRKGPEPGNASYYYSLTRMPASGRVVTGGDTIDVSGRAWLDREWSTSVLSSGEVGWDWFALQMDDGWDLMIYRLRRADGSASVRSEGVLVAPDGMSTRLSWGEEVRVESTDTWTSPRGTTYPSGWRVSVPSRGWALVLEPLIEDQELDVSIRYWEGAVTVRSADPGGPAGAGYVELTGYDGAPPSR